MRNQTVRCCAGLILALIVGGSAQAKWWIFGRSKAEVELDYVFFNDISVEGVEGRVTMPREFMPQGLLVIRGRATCGKGRIGAVQISLDNKESWQKAKTDQRGVFEFSFRPEADTVYKILIKAIATTGVSNDVDDTLREFSVSNDDLRAMIVQLLDELVAAYSEEDARRFIAVVSEEFTGDDVILDRAIRKDFTLFEDIDLGYSLNNIARDARGLIYVSITYRRRLVSARSGDSLRDRGQTEFVFRLEGGKAKIYSMKNPLIFGLSDAGEVATGNVAQSGNGDVLVVDANGDVDVVPYNEAVEIIEEDGELGGDIESGTMNLEGMDGWDFEDSAKTTNFGADSDFDMDTGNLMFKNGAAYQDLGLVGVNDVDEAPAAGYSAPNAVLNGLGGLVGHTIAIKLGNGNYALIELTDYQAPVAPNFQELATFRYRYQTDGSRNF